MKSTCANVAACLVAMGSAAVAQTTVVQSAPFALYLNSTNATLNGQYLAPCHEGAGIESLCTADTNTTFTYTLNTTYYNGQPANANNNSYYGTAGTLVYTLLLAGGGDYNISQGFSLQYYPTTNVANGLFGVEEDNIAIAFDETERMNIQSNYEDITTPPSIDTTSYLYNWFLCESNEIGHIFDTLNWVVGVGAVQPQNPSCQAVGVYREFV